MSYGLCPVVGKKQVWLSSSLQNWLPGVETKILLYINK